VAEIVKNKKKKCQKKKKIQLYPKINRNKNEEKEQMPSKGIIHGN